MKRRELLQSLAAGSLAATAATAHSALPSRSCSGRRELLEQAIARFRALPVDAASCAIEIALPDRTTRITHNHAQRLFIGSAVKTFVLAQFLRDVETGDLRDADGAPFDYYDEQSHVAVDDAIRTAGSPVLIDVNGTVPWFGATEAMIAHSDNTGTDIALAAATPARVRALLAQAGMPNTQIAESMRRLLSYIAGAPYGTDIGWTGVLEVAQGNFPGAPRSPFNDKETLASTAEEMTSWYRQALTGAFFANPETLHEFKRVQAMCHVIAEVVPQDTVAYAKNGWIDWEGFHAQCIPGQMIVREVPVTFCFNINWNEADQTRADALIAQYKSIVAAALSAAADFVRACA